MVNKSLMDKIVKNEPITKADHMSKYGYQPKDSAQSKPPKSGSSISFKDTIVNKFVAMDSYIIPPPSKLEKLKGIITNIMISDIELPMELIEKYNKLVEGKEC